MLPSNDFWRREDLLYWQEIDDLALASILAGATAGEAWLPRALRPLINEEMFNTAAMAYLRRYQLVDIPNINATTRMKAARMIEEWLRSGEALPALETKLATILNSRRAAQIAVTEVTRLFAQGNLMLWRSVGVVTSKVWRTARDEKVCPLCGPLDGQVVSMEVDFQNDPQELANSRQMKALLGARWSEELAMQRVQNMLKWNGSGVEAPPRHVNCRCYIQPVVSVQAFEESLAGILG